MSLNGQDAGRSQTRPAADHIPCATCAALVELLTEQVEERQRLQEQLATCEADRAARLEVIHKLSTLLATAEAQRDACQQYIRHLEAALAASRMRTQLRRIPGKVLRLFQGRRPA
jgi:hypothetical protein